MVKIRIWDKPTIDGKEMADRYTVCIEYGEKDRCFYGISETGRGFNQFVGSDYEFGPHLGKRVRYQDLNKDLQKAIAERLICD